MANPFANSVKFLKAIDFLSSPNGTTIKGLMEGLDISRRSVFRLFEALAELGFPVVDKQPVPRGEKRYCLMESYVVQLPNMALPAMNFSKEESELLLSMLDFCINIQKSKTVIILKGIRQKVEVMTLQNRKEQKP